MSTPDDRSIHERMVAILAEMPAIPKDAENKQQGFMFRSYDAMLDFLNPLLGKHGVFFTPQVLRCEWDSRVTAKGGTLYVTRLEVRYTFFGLRGDMVTATGVGLGTDSGDKDTSKAMTMAMKSVLQQVFAVSVREVRDPDADTPEPSEPDQAECKKCPTVIVGALSDPVKMRAHYVAEHGYVWLPDGRVVAPTKVPEGLVVVETALGLRAVTPSEVQPRESEPAQEPQDAPEESAAPDAAAEPAEAATALESTAPARSERRRPSNGHVEQPEAGPDHPDVPEHERLNRPPEDSTPRADEPPLIPDTDLERGLMDRETAEAWAAQFTGSALKAKARKFGTRTSGTVAQIREALVDHVVKLNEEHVAAEAAEAEGGEAWAQSEAERKLAELAAREEQAAGEATVMQCAAVEDGCTFTYTDDQAGQDAYADHWYTVHEPDDDGAEPEGEAATDATTGDGTAADTPPAQDLDQVLAAVKSKLAQLRGPSAKAYSTYRQKHGLGSVDALTLDQASALLENLQQWLKA